jgi:recombination protein RecR
MSRFLNELIAELAKLPGIGEKNAERIAYHLLKRPADENRNLGNHIESLQEKVRFCGVCGNFTEERTCSICEDPSRDRTRVCVVEEPKYIKIFEKLKIFRGVYHVLGGVISPLNGVGPSDLAIDSLVEKARKDGVTEVILALNQTTEAELTGFYIHKLLKPLNVGVSKLMAGIPVGSDIEYIDVLTLSKSFESRSKY